MPEREPRVAVVGATGVVGQTIARVLEERGFPVGDYVPVATDRSGGRTVEALGRSWPVRTSDDVDFADVDFVFFTAGASVSRRLVPRVVDGGSRAIDNTTAFRMEADVPLVVPEINGSLVTAKRRLVACPNCTAINLVMALAPLMRKAPLERVVVTSFQSVSGAGKDALDELEASSKLAPEDERVAGGVFEKPIAFNCLPAVGNIEQSGYTTEEEKIVEETRKILSLPELHVVPTAVRVPVRVGHSLAISVELGDALDTEEAKSLWNEAPGVTYDDGLPTPLDIAGKDTVVVGRVRKDTTRPHAIVFWVVGDNLRKGAATNSVQIAELMMRT